MTNVEALGLVAGLVAIFEAGYVIGAWRTKNRQRSIEDDLVSNKIRDVLSNVKIKKLECNVDIISSGQTIPISLTISNGLASSIEVWIGAV